MVQAAAATLGSSECQTYTLLRRCWKANGELTALVLGQSNGGRDRRRTAPASEAALRRVVQEVYLTPQKPAAARWRAVAGRLRVKEKSRFCDRHGHRAALIAQSDKPDALPFS